MDKRKYLNEIFYKNEFKDSKSSFLLISFLRMCVTAAPKMFLKRPITCQSSLSEWMASGLWVCGYVGGVCQILMDGKLFASH